MSNYHPTISHELYDNRAKLLRKYKYGEINMKKILTITIIASMLSLLAYNNAEAKDLTRRFGIGVDSGLSNFYDGSPESVANSNRGISVKYFFQRYIGIQLITAVRTITAKGDKVGTAGNYNLSKTFWNVSLRALVPIALAQDVNLNAIAGFTAAGVDGGTEEIGTAAEWRTLKQDSVTRFFVDLALQPEWFASEHFSLHTQVGLAISIITSDNGIAGKLTDTKAKGADFDFFQNANLLGQAGFTFYF